MKGSDWGLQASDPEVSCVHACHRRGLAVYQSCISGCRILKEERNYILQMIKKIRASGANVLLIQKSILRDAVTDLSLHYLVCSLFPA